MRRRVRGAMRMGGWIPPASRIVHTEGQIATSAVSDTEVITTIFSAADAPTNQSTIEAGAKLAWLRIVANGAVHGGTPTRVETLLYRDKSNLTITASAPISNYVSTTEPSTKAENDIREAVLGKNPLHGWSSNTGANIPSRFSYFVKFKKGMQMRDGDVIKVAIRANEAASRTYNYWAKAGTFK